MAVKSSHDLRFFDVVLSSTSPGFIYLSSVLNVAHDYSDHDHSPAGIQSVILGMSSGTHTHTRIFMADSPSPPPD